MRKEVREIWSGIPCNILDLKNVPSDLTQRRIHAIIGMDSRCDRTIRKKHWDFLQLQKAKSDELVKQVTQVRLGVSLRKKPAHVDPIEIALEQIPPDLIAQNISPPTPYRPIQNRMRGRLGVFVLISEETYYELHSEVRRTRVSPGRLLRFCDGKPDGLNRTTVERWLSGNTRSARHTHISFVLFHYARLPDAPAE